MPPTNEFTCGLNIMLWTLIGFAGEINNNNNKVAFSKPDTTPDDVPE